MKTMFFAAACLLIAPAMLTAQGIRKSFVEMTTAERLVYQNALQNSADIVEELADYHGNGSNFGPLHSSSSDTQFLPWHRMMLWEMEDALRRNGENDVLTIPYWDWTQDGTDETDALFTTFLPETGWSWRSFSRCFDCGTTPQDPLPTSGDISDLQALDVFWSNYVTLSNAYHLGAHGFVGGDLRGDYSPIDPLFYLHHAMVDKLWQEWEEQEGTSYTTGGLPHAMLRYDGSTVSSTFGTLPEADNYHLVDMLSGTGRDIRVQVRRASSIPAPSKPAISPFLRAKAL
jgi:hypothetical protein